MSVPKVAICVPFYRSVEGPTLLSCMELAMRSAATCAMLPIGTSGCYVEDNRNGCVEFALNTGIPFDWLLWIDGDMVFPGDALLRLIAHDKDIVGANYRQRTPPYKFVGPYADGSDTHLLEPGLHRMAHLAAGLLLTRFDIYRKMPYPWFKPGVHNEARDEVYFCMHAKSLGYEIWCDHDLTNQVSHLGQQQIGWFTKDQIIEVKGAQINLDENKGMSDDRAAIARREYEAATRSAA